MRNSIRVLASVILILSAVGGSFGQDQPTVLVVYYSAEGHTHAMAEAVAKGAQLPGKVTVKLLSVEQATTEDVLSADAIIVGSPVHNANVATPVQEFINRWPFEGALLSDKIGAAFVTAGGISAGEELAQLNILHSMLIFGMIVVGGPDWRSAFGASAVTMEQPFDLSQNKGGIDDHFLKKGEALGKRVAELTLKWRTVRQNK